MPEQTSLQNNIISTLERRQDRLEEVADRLTSISADLSKMIAVHELRISQQEKMTDSIEVVLEKRRDEFEARSKEIFETIERENKNVLEEVHNSYESLSKKISDLEKMIWLYVGGMGVAAFIVANWGDVLKLIVNK